MKAGWGLVSRGLPASILTPSPSSCCLLLSVLCPPEARGEGVEVPRLYRIVDWVHPAALVQQLVVHRHVVVQVVKLAWGVTDIVDIVDIVVIVYVSR